MLGVYGRREDCCSDPRRGCSAGRAPSQLMPLARPATYGSVPGTSWRGELTPHSCSSHGNPLSSRNVVSRETSVRSAHDFRAFASPECCSLALTRRPVVAQRVTSPRRAVSWQARSLSRCENWSAGKNMRSDAVKNVQLALAHDQLARARGLLSRTIGPRTEQSVSWQ